MIPVAAVACERRLTGTIVRDPKRRLRMRWNIARCGADRPHVVHPRDAPTPTATSNLTITIECSNYRTAGEAAPHFQTTV
jgi:hypothetical protein